MMETIIAIVLLISCCFYVTFADELRMVHALWRHGDRNPSGIIPTDVNNSALTWPQGLGELTTEGMRQQFLLGRKLNERYSGKLISINYSQPEIYIRSDDCNRTLMSAMANLAGIYSNSTSGVQVSGWPAIYWQPIPVHTVARSEDNLLYMKVKCPKVDQIQSQIVYQQTDYLNYSAEYQPLVDYLNTVCGFDYQLTFGDIHDVFDPLNCELIHHNEHRWPDYINGTIFDFVRSAHYTNSKFDYVNPTVARLRGGNLLNDIVQRMQQKQASLREPKKSSLVWVRNVKFYGYSAHDSTISAFMSTLGAQNYIDGQPGYAACVLIELWSSKNDEYYVKSYYRQNSTAEFFEFQVDGCSDFSTGVCSLKQFYSRSIPFIPINWEQECAIGLSSRSSVSTLFVMVCVSIIALAGRIQTLFDQ